MNSKVKRSGPMSRPRKRRKRFVDRIRGLPNCKFGLIMYWISGRTPRVRKNRPVKQGVSRPMNVFFAYRTLTSRLTPILPYFRVLHQKDTSKRASRNWHGLADEGQAFWRTAQHQTGGMERFRRMHPKYRYQPRTKVQIAASNEARKVEREQARIRTAERRREKKEAAKNKAKRGKAELRPIEPIAALPPPAPIPAYAPAGEARSTTPRPRGPRPLQTNSGAGAHMFRRSQQTPSNIPPDLNRRPSVDPMEVDTAPPVVQTEEAYVAGNGLVKKPKTPGVVEKEPKNPRLRYLPNFKGISAKVLKSCQEFPPLRSYEDRCRRELVIKEAEDARLAQLLSSTLLNAPTSSLLSAQPEPLCAPSSKAGPKPLDMEFAYGSDKIPINSDKTSPQSFRIANAFAASYDARGVPASEPLAVQPASSQRPSDQDPSPQTSSPLKRKRLAPRPSPTPQPPSSKTKEEQPSPSKRQRVDDGKEDGPTIPLPPLKVKPAISTAMPAFVRDRIKEDVHQRQARRERLYETFHGEKMGARVTDDNDALARYDETFHDDDDSETETETECDHSNATPSRLCSCQGGVKHRRHRNYKPPSWTMFVEVKEEDVNARLAARKERKKARIVAAKKGPAKPAAERVLKGIVKPLRFIGKPSDTNREYVARAIKMSSASIASGEIVPRDRRKRVRPPAGVGNVDVKGKKTPRMLLKEQHDQERREHAERAEAASALAALPDVYLDDPMIEDFPVREGSITPKAAKRRKKDDSEVKGPTFIPPPSYTIKHTPAREDMPVYASAVVGTASNMNPAEPGPSSVPQEPAQQPPPSPKPRKARAARPKVQPAAAPVQTPLAPAPSTRQIDEPMYPSAQPVLPPVMIPPPQVNVNAYMVPTPTYMRMSNMGFAYPPPPPAAGFYSAGGAYHTQGLYGIGPSMYAGWPPYPHPYPGHMVPQPQPMYGGPPLDPAMAAQLQEDLEERRHVQEVFGGGAIVSPLPRRPKSSRAPPVSTLHEPMPAEPLSTVVDIQGQVDDTHRDSLPVIIEPGDLDDPALGRGLTPHLLPDDGEGALGRGFTPAFLADGTTQMVEMLDGHNYLLGRHELRDAPQDDAVASEARHDYIPPPANPADLDSADLHFTQLSEQQQEMLPVHLADVQKNLLGSIGFGNVTHGPRDASLRALQWSSADQPVGTSLDRFPPSHHDTGEQEWRTSDPGPSSYAHLAAGNAGDYVEVGRYLASRSANDAIADGSYDFESSHGDISQAMYEQALEGFPMEEFIDLTSASAYSSSSTSGYPSSSRVPLPPTFDPSLQPSQMPSPVNAPIPFPPAVAPDEDDLRGVVPASITAVRTQDVQQQEQRSSSSESSERLLTPVRAIGKPAVAAGTRRVGRSWAKRAPS